MQTAVSIRQHEDSFGLLRLCAASLVLWSHQFILTLGPSYVGFFHANLGIYVFFAISGYLNTLSLIRNPSWWRFLIRRAFRIYPALVGLAFFCVALSAFITTAYPRSFWIAVPEFLFKNSTILFGLQFTLPGVFEANPYSDAINGTLWTLPAELKLYICLAIIAVATRYNTIYFLCVVVTLLIGILIWFHVVSKDAAIAHNAAKWTVVFLSGVFLALAENIKSRAAMPAFLLIAAIAALGGALTWFLPGLALVTVYLGKLKPPSWLQPKIDISYGVYLFGFPVQQLIASYGAPFWLSFIVSVTITIIFALLSAIFIEQPALRWRRSIHVAA
jgi:peptidoglycan/LPS O-acetylase OafA/YrhL